MNELNQPASFADQQNAMTAFLSSTWANAGTESLLNLQADFLVGMESAMADWLHRRHEAVLDAKRLLMRLRDTQDINEQLRAHQEWITGAWRRLAADATSFQSALLVANRSGHEAEENSRAAASATSAAPPSTGNPQAAKSDAR
jgi:hypothetical protein